MKPHSVQAGKQERFPRHLMWKQCKHCQLETVQQKVKHALQANWALWGSVGSLLSLCCPGTRCHDICCEKGQGQAGSIWKDCLGSPPSAAKVCSQSWRHLLFTDVLSRSYCLQSPSLHLAQWRLSDTSEVVCLDDALYGWGTWDAVMHCSLEHLKPTEKNDKQFMPYYIIICSFILGSYWVDFSLE